MFILRFYFGWWVCEWVDWCDFSVFGWVWNSERFLVKMDDIRSYNSDLPPDNQLVVSILRYWHFFCLFQSSSPIPYLIFPILTIHHHVQQLYFTSPNS